MILRTRGISYTSKYISTSYFLWAIAAHAQCFLQHINKLGLLSYPRVPFQLASPPGFTSATFRRGALHVLLLYVPWCFLVFRGLFSRDTAGTSAEERESFEYIAHPARNNKRESVSTSILYFIPSELQQYLWTCASSYPRNPVHNLENLCAIQLGERFAEMFGVRNCSCYSYECMLQPWISPTQQGSQFAQFSRKQKIVRAYSMFYLYEEYRSVTRVFAKVRF